MDVSVEVGAMLVESMLMGAETSSAIPTLLTLASATAQLLDHIFCSLETTWLILLTCNKLATINILKRILSHKIVGSIWIVSYFDFDF